jgi:hypothetical protein
MLTVWYLPDVKDWEGFRLDRRGPQFSNIWRDIHTTKVWVTKREYCVDRDQQPRIPRHEVVAKFLSKLWPQTVEATLERQAQAGGRFKDSELVEAVDGVATNVSIRTFGCPRDLSIFFVGTPRLPRDGKQHSLREFGSLPLYNAKRFARCLPESVVARGGLILPLHRTHPGTRHYGKANCGRR